jgi:hypothetical protein
MNSPTAALYYQAAKRLLLHHALSWTPSCLTPSPGCRPSWLPTRWPPSQPTLHSRRRPRGRIRIHPGAGRHLRDHRRAWPADGAASTARPALPRSRQPPPRSRPPRRRRITARPALPRSRHPPRRPPTPHRPPTLPGRQPPPRPPLRRRRSSPQRLAAAGAGTGQSEGLGVRIFGERVRG